MASAKDILVKPINARAANALVKKVHYSGKVVANSTLHLGVFLNDKLEGIMSFGSPLDKRKMLPLVEGTLWNEMLELNRMAFSDVLPKNSESRALGVAFRLIKKHYPHIKWVLSFSDGTQCGDGTIYRASGFVLTGIKQNSQLYELKTGEKVHKMNFEAARPTPLQTKLRQQTGILSGSVTKLLKELDAKPLEGFQLRYIYFLDKSCKERLTVPILPFSKIDEVGAGMYKGEKVSLQDRRVKELT